MSIARILLSLFIFLNDNWNYIAKSIQPPTKENKADKLDQIINTIDNNYVKDLDKSEIENRAINAMLMELILTHHILLKSKIQHLQKI